MHMLQWGAWCKRIGHWLSAPAQITRKAALKTICVAIVSLSIAAPTISTSIAVEVDEILSDPALEQRARALSKQLRCLVCRGESVDESTAEFARDIRLLVRERLRAGDSDTAVLSYIQKRYGDYILMRPPVRGANWVLWLSVPIVLFIAAVLASVYIMRHSIRKPYQ